MQELNRRILLSLAILIVPTLHYGAETARRPVTETHECFRYNSSCGATVLSEITIFGCRYVSVTDTKYWTRYRFNVNTQADVTVTVTSTEFIPELGLAEADAQVYLAYNANTSRQNTISITRRVANRTMDVDIYAKSPYTGHFNLKISCASCIAPSFIQQPMSTTVPYNGRAVLTTLATGKEPITYAWFDVVEPVVSVGGGTQFQTPPLTKPATYFAHASNGCGTARSLDAIVQPGACEKPGLTSVAANLNVDFGRTATLEVHTIGTAPFTYQWYEGLPQDISRPQPNGTESRLSLTVTRSSSYWVRVTNVCGSTDSTRFTVTTTAPPRRRSARH